MPRRLVMTRQVRDWLHALRAGDPVTRRLVAQAIDQLLDEGPQLGRPLVDRITGSRLHNLKELRARVPAGTARCESCSSSTRCATRCYWWPVISPVSGRSGTARRSRRQRRCTSST